MNVVIVFNHPYEKSYCAAIRSAVQSGLERAKHSVHLIHLDNEHFNPVMSAEDLNAFRQQAPLDPQVLKYKEVLDRADHLVFIFPIWWELMPAMTKGFIDKVIFPGLAYEQQSGGRMKPLLPGLNGVTIISTMNTPKPLYRFIFGNAIKKALVLGTFWKIGYKNIKWLNFTRVKSVSDAKRKKWLVQLEDRFYKLK